MFSMTPILEVRSLQVRFATGFLRRGRTVHALAGVDLSVNPGESLGLVGESGCGKTTFARCALYLQQPAAGSVYFDGSDLSRISAAALRQRRREFQMVFQDSFASLDPRMTIGEILAEPFIIHRLATRRRCHDKVLELLAAVALDGSLASRYPGELSGGQQQRVAIARALALQPRLLVADEPVSALDASVQAQILNLLADIRKRYGLTLILISHSLAVVQYLCSRVAVMYLGRIVEEGPSEEFFLRPRHPYSQALLDSMPIMRFERADSRPALTGDLPSPAAPPPGCAFHPRCPKASTRCREELPELQTIQNNKVACFFPNE
jgi:oligopeptide/dipeptide ABC transporter ATP-binding protein